MWTNVQKTADLFDSQLLKKSLKEIFIFCAVIKMIFSIKFSIMLPEN